MKVNVEVSVSVEVGDVVFLTSDLDQTTPMTVEDISECECGVLNVDTVWADYGDIKRDSFPMSCVTLFA